MVYSGLVKIGIDKNRLFLIRAGIKVENETDKINSRMSSMGVVRIFPSYAHKDEEYFTQMKKHLSLLEYDNVIIWSDREIKAGENWKNEIGAELKEADIILCLVSPDFFNSDFIKDNELPIALEREKKGGVKIIPIYIRSCDFEITPLGKFQALPENLIPVSDWENKDEAFCQISKGIRKVIDKIREKTNPTSSGSKPSTTDPSPKSKGRNHLEPFFKYFPNRDNQILDFRKYLEKDESKVQFYFIHGERCQSPFGLYQKIGRREIPYICGKGIPGCQDDSFFIEDIIPLRPLGDHTCFDKIPSVEISARLSSGKDEIDRIEVLKLSEFCKSPKVRHKKYAIFCFEMNSKCWGKNSWKLLKDLCVDPFFEGVPENSPTFIFFFLFNYDSPTKKKEFLGFLGEISQIKILPELEVVSIFDIETWFDDYLTGEYEMKKFYIEKYFKESKAVNMKDTEESLEKIIEDYKNNYEKEFNNDR